MIQFLEKIGHYFFHWLEIYYRALGRMGLFCLLFCPFFAQGQNLSASAKKVADGLTVPWEIEWMGDEKIIFSELGGRIGQVDLRSGKTTELFQIADVAKVLQAGLNGLQLHPDFPKTPLIYAAYTAYKEEDMVMHLVELKYVKNENRLELSRTLVDDLPSSPTTLGGRLLVTGDGHIFLSIGDHENSEQSQNLSTLDGKILRFDLDGKIPNDNPFPESPIWAVGIRNSHGMVAAPITNHESPVSIFFMEHGVTTNDELNILEKGANYGWPLVSGHCDEKAKNTCEKIKHHEPLMTWTPTIAPAGAEFYGHEKFPFLKNSLLVADLAERDLMVIFLDEKLEAVQSVESVLSDEIGRFRDVAISPDGRVFVSTSGADIYGGQPVGSDGIFEVVFEEQKPDLANFQNLPNLNVNTADDTLTLDSTQLEVRILTRNLVHPWDMTWGFDDKIWFTENEGWVKRLDPATGDLDTMLHLEDCHFSWGNPGIYSLAFHPEFPKEPYLFLHYTDSPTNSKLTRWRYDFDSDKLTDSISILPKITANESHNGSRMVFAPDGTMFFAMGEAYTPELAPDLNSLNGKILRLNLDGTVPEDNPFPGKLVWSYGHRNPQGLALLPNGTLWSSEHGATNDDELNLIFKGQNYGWPKVQGKCDTQFEMRYCAENQVIEPIISWTPTVAPCALEYYDHPAIPEWRNCLMQVFLKKGKGRIGQRMTVYKLGENGRSIVSQEDFFVNKYGRLRDVLFAPDGRVFISTSNKEVSGNGKKVVVADDDKIIELRPIKK